MDEKLFEFLKSENINLPLFNFIEIGEYDVEVLIEEVKEKKVEADSLIDLLENIRRVRPKYVELRNKILKKKI